MSEIVWKQVPGAQEGFMVSTEGRVVRKIYRPYRLPDGSLALEFVREREITRGLQQGYENVSIPRIDGSQKRWRVNVLVATTFIPNPEGHPIVRHLDGDRLNNKVENLAWGTQAMNMADAVAHGSICRNSGRSRRQARVHNDDVKAIRERLSDGSTQREIVEEYGIPQSTVSEIARGVGAYQGLSPIVLQDPNINKRHKLSLESRKEIIEALKNGAGQTALAKKYGVSQTLISHINLEAGGIGTRSFDRLNPELDAAVIAQRRAGVPRENTLEDFGISSATYYNIIKRNLA